MRMFVSPERFYLSPDRTRIAPPGEHDHAILLVAVGGQIPLEVAEAYGIADTPGARVVVSAAEQQLRLDEAAIVARLLPPGTGDTAGTAR